MPLKPRLDELLVARGFFASADAAARACLAGRVRSGDTLLTLPGQRLLGDMELSVVDKPAFVSRGGEKLAGALADFDYHPQGLRCLDVGASTGGFSDCLLKAGAALVVAVDVGYGQFDYGLRNDERVILHERTNISTVSPASLKAPFDLIVVDVSFSPLARLLPLLGACAEAGSDLIALCKPQFELPRSLVGTGVVRERDAHIQALEKVIAACARTDWGVRGLACSRLRGAKGNIEFFFWATWGATPATIDAGAVVKAAHRRFTK
jgi:23S rRNA (cytidine1920-2'-O)/16S rRNA (cytidine1409-2'-O)-methyltransferase